MKGIQQDLEAAIRYAIDQMFEDDSDFMDDVEAEEEFKIHVKDYLIRLGYPEALISKIGIQLGRADLIEGDETIEGHEKCRCGYCDVINSPGSDAEN